MAIIVENEKKLHVSPSIDERAIDHFAEKRIGNAQPEPDPEHQALSGAMKLAREEAHALANLASAVFADRSQTPAAAALQVADAAQKTGKRVADRLDAAFAKVNATISSLEKVTFAPAGETPLDSEIRAAVKAMTPAQRTKALAEADMTILGAVLRAPGLLTGMNEAELELLRHNYRQKHFPVEMKRLERLKKMRTASETGGKAFVNLVLQAADTKFANGAIEARVKREQALAAHQQGA